MQLIEANFERNKDLPLRKVFENDFELLKLHLGKEEFFEGVRFILLDKGKTETSWMYKTINEIPDSLIQTYMSYNHPDLKLDLV